MKKVFYTLLLTMLYLTALREVNAQTYTWNQVRIGGSGALPSFVAHPKVPDLYFVTTDVGTPYRWNKNLQKWEHLMLFKKIPINYWGWEFSQRCGSIGVDPNDTTGNILYATVEHSAGPGPGKGSSTVGTILKSTDRGDSWTDLHVPIVVHPNTTQTYGERIQVDPANSNRVWVVTDQNGAWKSEDAGTTWAQVDAVTTAGNCSFLLFDKSSGTINLNGVNVTRRIYIGRSNGVFVSEDGGGSFNQMNNSPMYPNRATLHADGTLYISAGAENLPKGVFKYKDGNWQDISPLTLVPDPVKSDRYFAKVAVNPANSDDIVVSVRGSWQKDPYFISRKGGAPGYYRQGQIKRDNSEAPHSANDGEPYNDPGHNAYAFTWDPFYPDRVWINDLTDILCTDNIFASVSDWKIRVVGLEEIMVTGPLVAPPSGKNLLLTSTADVGGGHHRSLTEPLYEGAVSYTDLHNNVFSAFEMQGAAFQYTDPNFIVRVGSDGAENNDPSACRAGYSTDGGDHYTLFPKLPGIRGRVAVSANRRNILWLTQMDGNSPGNVYWSEDLGSSWTKSTGLASGILPAGAQWMLYPGQNHLVADKVNSDYFYVWDRGSFFVSTDGGKSFVKTAATGLTANAGSNPNGSSYATSSNIETTPGKTGDVWIAYHNEAYPEFSALYHTTDTGKTFTKVGGDNVKPKWIAVAMSDTTPNAHLVLYVTSQALPINGVYDGAFRSDDTGRTWTTILDRLPGVAPNIAADNKGRMFISAHGNGIFFGTPVAGPVQSVEIINSASDTIVKGYAVKLNVKLSPTYPTNPSVTWSSSDTAIAKVDQYGNVSGMNAGIATITVTSVDGGKTSSRQITVIPPTISTGIAIDSIVYATMNAPRQISAAIIPANTTNKTLHWSVADTTIATVDANGIATGFKLGTTTLTISAADGGFTKTVQLIVNTTVIAINAGTTANPATPYQNTVIGQYVPEGPSGTDKLWHAGYTGSTRITATVDLSQVTSPAPRQIYEYMRVSRYNVTQMRYYFRNLIPNANYSLRLHFIEPSDADKANRVFNVKTSGDSLINFNVYQAAGNKLNTVITRTLEAKADVTGVITVNFIPKGVTNGPYSASIAALEANIIPLQGISIYSDSSNLYVSYKDTLKLSTTPANATNRNLVYKSSDNAIATVDLNGVVTGKAAGTVTITATSVESNFTATKTYTVIYIPATAITLDSTSANVFVGSALQLNATISPVKASNKGVVWTSSDTTVAKVSSNGTISGIKQGDVIITATSADNPAIAAQANIHVANVLATGLAFQPSTAVVGERDTLRVAVNFLPANTSIKRVTWSSSNTTLATIDSTGLITAIKQGSLTVTANTQDGSGVSATLQVTVAPFDSCGGIPNYGFESGLINWVAYKDTIPTVGAVYTVSGKGHSGDKAATLGFTTAHTSLNIQGSIPVRGGSLIVFTQWVKVDKDATGYPWWAGYGVGFIDSLGASTGNASYSKQVDTVIAYRDNWAQIRDTINVPDSATGLTYWVSKVGFGTLWVDDYCIEVLKTNQSALYGINAGTTQTPPGPYANTTFAQYVPEGPTGTDKLWHAGYTWVQKVNSPVDVSHVIDPAPPQVYEYMRIFKDNITQMRYYLRGLTPNTVYAIRLHFVEPQDTEKNKRIFSIRASNGLDSLIDFNVYQAAGNKLNTAVIKTIRAKADNAGLIQVFFYPKKGLYDPYSGSIAAIEVRTLQPGDTLQNAAANQNIIAAVNNKPDTHVNLDFTTDVYPNPSGNVFNVKMTSSSKAPALLIIVNNAGNIIYSTRIIAGTYYQLGQNLKPGIYYINIRQGDQSKTMKVVKR
ncbi:Ig-like domain-containing protein [Chitinophaga filiformis]|uniref:Por secretion system C-terminal sorting domain-containing protein n=1 Tax=Chitinophaga filiformis TaxID=104663 RepID=A0A1G7SXW5_CHIFI|nr:Ig-like domain-containing protein [Chitinophaga filiformis]SDG27269.1 Por secretion system C-terminal sorting domain-containing protein [Chitinophaga filiformis]